MPSADVAVIGAGLAGLSCAVELAERGARVFVAAKGMAATHWTHGGIDVAAPAGATTARAGVALLSGRRGHPYAHLAADVEPALDAHFTRLAGAGLSYGGDLDAPLVTVPTAVGTTRRASHLPVGQAPALDAWGDDGLLVVGFERFRDAWPAFAAGNLARVAWPGGPTRVAIAEAVLPGLGDLRNLNALTLAHLFDEAAWRTRALDAIAAVIPAGRWRIALPATLGLASHAETLALATATLGAPILEIVSVPPSVPGLRLFEALRGRLLAAGGRLHWGFWVTHVERDRDRVRAIHTEGASRTLRVAADAFVLASGGVAGGGLRAAPDGTLTERVFGLQVTAPAHDDWFTDEALAPQPIEAAGIEVDAELRPLLDGPRNVHVIGSALAGMRYLDERCGDGVALASGHRVARLLGRADAAASVRREGAA